MIVAQTRGKREPRYRLRAKEQASLVHTAKRELLNEILAKGENKQTISVDGGQVKARGCHGAREKPPMNESETANEWTEGSRSSHEWKQVGYLTVPDGGAARKSGRQLASPRVGSLSPLVAVSLGGVPGRKQMLTYAVP